MQALLHDAMLLTQLSLVDEEVSRRGVSEQQAQWLGVDEQVEPHLGGALGAQTARRAGAGGVVERSHAIERATARFSILV